MNDQQGKNALLERKYNLGLSHKQFVKRLCESQEAVLFVKKYIESKGHKVYVPKLKITPDVESKDEYSDEVDLIFYRKNGKTVRVEIKQFTINFTDTEFKYPEIIVNSYLGYSNKKIKPDIHIILSKNRKYVAIISLATQNKWNLKKAYDRVKKRRLYFYFLKKEYVKFIKL
jgi:hypothetical protein